MEKDVAGGGSLITTFSTLASSVEFAFTVVGVSASLAFEPTRPFQFDEVIITGLVIGKLSLTTLKESGFHTFSPFSSNFC